MHQSKPEYQTNRKPFIAFSDLRNRDRWPRADSSRCCIFEAIELIGTALFGPDWSGEELHALEWPLEPRLAEAERLHKMNTPAPVNSGGGAGMGRAIVFKELPFMQHVIDRMKHLYEIERARSVDAEQGAWEANRALTDRLVAVVDSGSPPSVEMDTWPATAVFYRAGN